MSVEKKGNKWVARASWCNEKIPLGIYGTQEAADAALAREMELLRKGESILWKEGTASYKGFADSIGVNHGTVKRWTTEGLPSTRDGLFWPRIPIKEGLAWVKANRSKSVAINRVSVVYVAERDDGLVKIGFTSDLARRVKELSKESGGVPVSLVAALPGDKPKELRLHALFEANRIEGEWYRVSANDVVEALRSA